MSKERWSVALHAPARLQGHLARQTAPSGSIKDTSSQGWREHSTHSSGARDTGLLIPEAGGSLAAIAVADSEHLRPHLCSRGDLVLVERGCHLCSWVGRKGASRPLTPPWAVWGGPPPALTPGLDRAPVSDGHGLSVRNYSPLAFHVNNVSFCTFSLEQAHILRRGCPYRIFSHCPTGLQFQGS